MINGDLPKKKGRCLGGNEGRGIELLDDITSMKYEQVLPPFVKSHRREILLNQFLELKGKLYIPANVHNSIKWSHSDPLIPLSTVKNIFLKD